MVADFVSRVVDFVVVGLEVAVVVVRRVAGLHRWKTMNGQTALQTSPVAARVRRRRRFRLVGKGGASSCSFTATTATEDDQRLFLLGIISASDATIEGDDDDPLFPWRIYLFLYLILRHFGELGRVVAVATPGSFDLPSIVAMHWELSRRGRAIIMI